MGLDGQLKRFFPLIIVMMVALSAYFQASGLGQLIGAAVIEGPTPASAVSPPSPARAKPRADGTPILSRNPFDNETGPLDGKAMPIPAAEEVESTTEVEGDPMQDPPCDFGRVVLISATEDPALSFASIEDKSGTAALRRRGDEVDGHTLQHLIWDRVWLQSGSTRCQMKMGAKTKSTPKKAKRKPSRKSKRKRRGRKIDPALAAKIHKVNDTEFSVERSVVDQILENQAQLMRSARIVPEKDGDKLLGIRLFGVRRGTLLETLGLKNGDRLESINGFNISDPQKALEAYGRLRTANQLKVKVNRRGKPLTIEFNIQ